MRNDDNNDNNDNSKSKNFHARNKKLSRMKCERKTFANATVRLIDKFTGVGSIYEVIDLIFDGTGKPIVDKNNVARDFFINLAKELAVARLQMLWCMVIIILMSVVLIIT